MRASLVFFTGNTINPDVPVATGFNSERADDMMRECLCLETKKSDNCSRSHLMR
jgi:hypothetical protein